MAFFALSNVRGHGDGRLPNLIAKDQLVLLRKGPCCPVAPNGKVHRLLPNKEIAERSDFCHAAEKARHVPLEYSRKWE